MAKAVRPLTVRLWLLLALIALTASSGWSASQGDAQAIASYLEHVRVLADPAMGGRGAGMPGLEQAAGYIEKQFEDAGLQPAGVDGTFMQPFEVTTDASMGETNILRVTRGDGSEDLELNEDFIPINFSGSGVVEGDLAFVGYGATATEFGYDDYFHMDVRDKLVIVLRYEPDFFHESEGDEEEGRRRRERRYTRHSHLIAKAIQARHRGAKAVLLVDARTRGQRADRLIRFGSVSGPTDAGIPMVQVHRDVVESWLRGSGSSLRLLERDIGLSKQPQSFTLGPALRVRLEVDVQHERATVRNVAGYLPGKSDQYLVLGAHYDHLGLGGEGSLAPSQHGKVHPGADDNASGVAAIIELARHYSASDTQARLGLLFLAFAAEEIGLLGSSHWVDNPTLPLENAAAMLNFDMVGRIKDRRLFVGGLGTAAELEAIVKGAAKNHDLRLDKSSSSASSSDHTSFASKNIPVLFFFSGLHSDYHKPSDTAEKINGESAVQLLGVARDVIGEIDAQQQRMAFVESAPRGHGGRDTPGGGSGYGPWFGSVPDFGEVPNGVKFADIRVDSPAKEAGLMGGDILTHWNGDAVQNLHDFTYALRASAVGDVVTVRFLRDGKEMTAEVTLAERP